MLQAKAKLRDAHFTVSREIDDGIDKIRKDILNKDYDVGIIVASINHVRTLMAKSRAISKEYAKLVAKEYKEGEENAR